MLRCLFYKDLRNLFLIMSAIKWYLESLHMNWFYNEMIFRIFIYQMISGFHMLYDGVQFLRSFRTLDTTLLKNELLCKYFSIISSADVEQTFCRKTSRAYFWRFLFTRLLKDTHVIIFWITILAFSSPLK